MPPSLPRRRDLREPATPRSRKQAGRDARRDAKVFARRAAAARKKTPTSFAKKLFPIAALGFAAALLVGSSLPASAFYVPVTAKAPTKSSVAQAPGQVLQESPAARASAPLARDGFSVLSYAEVEKMKLDGGDLGYKVDNSGPVRWPFDFAVPIGDRYGSRGAPCSGCSTFHHGVDFQPGDGSPIYAIAAGVVTKKDNTDPSLGNSVYITHEIKGQQVTSLYAHMQEKSSPLKVGETVKEGDIVGLVGSTGETSGPHLHFGILMGGPTDEPTDPLAWLLSHTKH